jgi:beta-mannanase
MIGVYRQAAAPSKTAEFEAWLGKPVAKVHDFLADEDWTKISGSGAQWFIDQWKNTPYASRMVWTVKLPVGATLEACAAGNYQTHWSQLAKKLKDAGMGGAIIRPLHEFDGDWYPRWHAAGRESTYVEAFRKIRQAMVYWSTAFRFDWCSTNTSYTTTVDLEAAYPGDAYVSYVGQDVYDNQTFANTVRRKYGLAWQLDFARKHNKAVSYPEWGLWGVDNPDFIERMLGWMKATDPAWNGWWEYGSSSLMGGERPNSATKFLELT